MATMKGKRNLPPASSVASAATVSASPASPTLKATAKYTNKDGSKFITVPKLTAPEARRPSTPPAPSPIPDNTARNSPQGKAEPNGSLPAGNRKKAKRRAKLAAAREKAELAGQIDKQVNGLASPTGSSVPGQEDYPPTQEDDGAANVGDESGIDNSSEYHTRTDNQEPPPDANKSKKAKKKKKKKKKDTAAASTDGGQNGNGTEAPHRAHAGRADTLSTSKEAIWNTNSQEERQRIKEFWLDLSEEQRKKLVKVEKDTVLKKMKEQQKMTCSCHFCGRKRTAIEEELEGLYDSYYEELEHFANDPTGHQNPPLMSSNGRFVPPSVSNSPAPGQQPSHGHIVEHAGDYEEDEGDEEFGDEDDLIPEDDESDCEDEDIPPEEIHRDYPADIFTFGNSLQVHGGILTVADDLLKNDGRKFIEMMEQLAERRMAREEDGKDQYSSRSGSYVQNGNGSVHGYNPHLAPDEDDYSPEDEEDEEYDSQDEEYEEEEDVLTEEQRMEEGRRMFQIFAARMFEQRVLNAYRKKVSEVRQQKLLDEIANEETQESQRKAKKAKDAQKRKDKAAQKRQAQVEEKARKDAEKAAEEANRQAEETRRLEEQRQRADEKRKKREAQRKAEEEERLRKEAERQRRAKEQRERQAEQDRRAREVREQDRKLKEEARRKEKESREKREREVRERREKQELARREKETGEKGKTGPKMAPVPAVPTLPPIRAAKASTTASSAPAAPSPATLTKKTAQQQQLRQPHAVPALPQTQAQPASFSSPQIPAATPIIPKAPTPMRARQASQHGGSTAGSQNGVGSRAVSLSGSGQSQNASPNPMTPVQASLASFATAKGSSGMNSINQSLASQGQSFAPTSPHSMPANQAAQQNSPFSIAPSPIGMHYPSGAPPVAPPPGIPLPSQFPPMASGNFRASGPPTMMPIPPALNRVFVPLIPPPGFSPLPPDQLGSPIPNAAIQADNNGVPSSHSRHPSAGYDGGSSPTPAAQPIMRPTPIGRPASIVHGQYGSLGTAGNGDDMGNPHHLGSRALLDDSDPAGDEFSARRPTSARSGFGAGPVPYGDLTSPFVPQQSLWGGLSTQTMPSAFVNGPPSGFPMGGMPLGTWNPPSNAPPFAPHGGIGRSSQARSVTLRQILCRACQELGGNTDPDGNLMALADGSINDTPIPIEPIMSRVRAIGQPYLGAIQDSELQILYDTEGNNNNGGGNFEVHRNADGAVTAIRWAPDNLSVRRSVGGEMGSPAVGFGDGITASMSTAPIGAAPGR